MGPLQTVIALVIIAEINIWCMENITRDFRRFFGYLISYLHSVFFQMTLSLPNTKRVILVSTK